MDTDASLTWLISLETNRYILPFRHLQQVAIIRCPDLGIATPDAEYGVELIPSSAVMLALVLAYRLHAQQWND